MTFVIRVGAGKKKKESDPIRTCEDANGYPGCSDFRFGGSSGPQKRKRGGAGADIEGGG